MKIVAIGDTHGSHRNLSLPDGDVLIHVGDYVMEWEPSPVSSTLLPFCRDWLLDQPFEHIICIAGNHDPEDCGDVLGVGRIHYLKDNTVEIDGVVFGGSPWSTPCCGNFNADEHYIDAAMRKMGCADVIITHSPPYGILDDTEDGINMGSVSIKERVMRRPPRLHVFGHCHNRGGEFMKHGKTVFANVSFGDLSPIFEMDI